MGNGIAEEGVNEEDNIGGGVGVKLWERRVCNEKGAGPPGENRDEGWYEDDSGWDGKGSLARSGSQLNGVVDADNVEDVLVMSSKSSSSSSIVKLFADSERRRGYGMEWVEDLSSQPPLKRVVRASSLTLTASRFKGKWPKSLLKLPLG